MSPFCALARACTLALLALALVAAHAGSARAAGPAAHWIVLTQPQPTDFHPGDGADTYELFAVNDGAASTAGPITVTDVLPAGVTVNAVDASAEVAAGVEPHTEVVSFRSSCTQATAAEVVTVSCTTSESVPVGRSVLLAINVRVPAGASGSLANRATIAGGGGGQAAADSSTLLTPAAQPVPFGASLASEITDQSGALATRAGSHPFAFSTLLSFNVASTNPEEPCHFNEEHLPCPDLNAQAKDVEVALPPGLVGNPQAMPRCTQAQFEGHGFFDCPADTQVGSMYLYFYGSGTAVQYAPVYNIEPPPGQPAELGFTVSTLAHIPIYFHVRSDRDFGLTADIRDINQFDPVRAALLSIWGVPADEAHNQARMSEFGKCGLGEDGCPSGLPVATPFLRLPTSCSQAPLTVTVAGDSWQNPLTAPFPELTSAALTPPSGCEAVPFAPSIAIQTSTRRAGALAGYGIHIDNAQPEGPEALATADVRDVELALPEGTVVSPSSANGLVSCSDAQFGLKLRDRGACPPESKIGTVKLTTPLLAQPLGGNLYVGQPECSPCTASQSAAGQMVHLLLEAAGSGVIIKLSGHALIDQGSGRLTTVFTENPQLPFSDLEVQLEQGPQAPLVNPASCGAAIAAARITPWSTLTATGVAAPAVQIEGCTPRGFAPAFSAGDTRTARAGSFTGFHVTLARNDGEQALAGISVRTPAGLLGAIRNVARCPEAEANLGTCPASSQIGTSSVTLGPGPLPLRVGGGKVFFTGPYRGRPFGLSIVTPAEAGPFKLAGNTGLGTQVVRAAIAVDPASAALTVTSDGLPQQLNGIPLDIRTVDIDIDREAFMFNPTSCAPLTIAATIAGASGAAAGASYPFQADDCALLPFKPRFTALTEGRTSKAGGASLHVKVTSGPGQANIGKVKVDLPLQLPSRLTTLQKACLNAVFVANPASCPAGSVVGQATAVTPVLASPLSGPAYLVSHGGAAFPDLEIVLQGEGLTLVLDGATDIKKGITSSAFRALPDAPISSFDLVLPQGPHSALAAPTNLCSVKALRMPTAITGQNGALVRQSTRIAVAGCPRKHRRAHSRVLRRGHRG